ncbi:MAG: hypothetical protein IJP92_04090 [Lachnospiraceae bacterium]|nr:hypothetical protein [Lachnospiraceae bacterium]
MKYKRMTILLVSSMVLSGCGGGGATGPTAVPSTPGRVQKAENPADMLSGGVAIGRPDGPVLPETEPVEKIYARIDKEFVELYYSESTDHTFDEWYYGIVAKKNALLEQVSYYTGVDAVYLIESREDASLSAEEYADMRYRECGYAEDAVVLFFDHVLKDWTLTLKGNAASLLPENWLEETAEAIFSGGPSGEFAERSLFGEYVSSYYKRLSDGLGFDSYILPVTTGYALPDGASVRVLDLDREATHWSVFTEDYLYEEDPAAICMGNYTFFGLDGYLTVKDYWGNLIYDIDLKEEIARLSSNERRGLEEVFREGRLTNDHVLLYSHLPLSIGLPYGSTVEYSGSGPLYLCSNGGALPDPEAGWPWMENLLLKRWEERLKNGAPLPTQETSKRDIVSAVDGISEGSWYPQTEQDELWGVEKEEIPLLEKEKGYSFTEIHALTESYLVENDLVPEGCHVTFYGRKRGGSIPHVGEELDGGVTTESHTLRNDWEEMQTQTDDLVILFECKIQENDATKAREVYGFLVDTVTLEGMYYKGVDEGGYGTGYYLSEGTAVSLKEELPDWEERMKPSFTPDEAMAAVLADLPERTGIDGWQILNSPGDCVYILSENGHAVRCKVAFACEAVKGEGFAEVDLYNLTVVDYRIEREENGSPSVYTASGLQLQQ